MRISLKTILIGAIGLLALSAAAQGVMSAVKLSSIQREVTQVATNWLPSVNAVEAADNNRAAIAACTATLMAFPLAVLFAARGPFILTSTASLPHRRPRDEAVRMSGRLPARSGNRRKPEIERRSLDLG